MIDVLAPLGLLLLVGFVVAFVLAARKQQQARGRIFQELAADAGWRHLAADDGTAEALAQGFDGFARFSSPSLGKLTPKNVVLGDVDEGRLCAFVHGTREQEDQARQWFVCVIEAAKPLCGAVLVRSRRTEARRVREVGVAPEVSFDEDPDFHRRFLVRARDAAGARRCLGSEARRFLLAGAGRLPFVPEAQIRGRRLAVYLAERNAEPESVEDLSALVSFTRGLARALTGDEAVDKESDSPE
jgi:hypothetical protein